MKKVFIFITCAIAHFSLCAKEFPVANESEFKAANNAVVPGDIILLKSGFWLNVRLTLTCKGTAAQPIVVKAQTAGKVLLTGHSTLKIGGDWLIIDGLNFSEGFSLGDAVVKFCVNKDLLANNCRLTNTVINNYNNPKRLDENYWIALYGKNNRIDHCSFVNKKNMGVLLAVILDDDRSRENFHSIDSNYFGLRLPLASNTGEIIRVGVSQHCEFNSNTTISGNYFEKCDGETEIISIKSGSNVVRGNVFKECQGSVVLRHGNFNSVEANIFLGNNKKGSGGVRIINKGQWVTNNFFYKCKGTGFRSPLCIMNGVPNSPAHRYVAVSDAFIANNTFVECAPFGFGEGSDTERSVPPKQVIFSNNLIYASANNQVYHAIDSINGINFLGNIIDKRVPQELAKGFVQATIQKEIVNGFLLPTCSQNLIEDNFLDSLKSIAANRGLTNISNKAGITDKKQIVKILEKNHRNAAGAIWFREGAYQGAEPTKIIKCSNATQILTALKTNRYKNLTILLTGTNYLFEEPLIISGKVTILAKSKHPIVFFGNLPTTNSLITIQAGAMLTLQNLNLNLAQNSSSVFIQTDTSGYSDHSSFSMFNSRISGCKGLFFLAAKTSVLDSIVIDRCKFNNCNGLIFDLSHENTAQGYYNVEQLIIENNVFENNGGQLLRLSRTGKDESTMGPYLLFSNNILRNINTNANQPLIYLWGVQDSRIEMNTFSDCNDGSILIEYKDEVNATHRLIKNSLNSSGRVVRNQFVIEKN